MFSSVATSNTFSDWLCLQGISSQQLQQCELLLEFIKDASDELRWLNEKEEEELTRNWNAKTMGADVMREHFQVTAYWQYSIVCL